MPFCSQSRPSLDFSFWSCSYLGCVDLRKVTLLCLWILCGILSVPRRTTCGLLASSKSLPLFAPLIFSTLVGRLWVSSFLELFLCLGSFGSMWSFLWSFIQVIVLLVSICSILVVVCCEWRWIYWTRNHVFHHSLPFSSLMFLGSFCVNLYVFLLLGLLRAFLIRLVSLASSCWYIFASSQPSWW